jgi:UDP-N-acetylglucosamine--N-acetylmuramyl-(pentapeptide) pyrophosphoryl-undecaprenol N-acetylglucosamine transferase
MHLVGMPVELYPYPKKQTIQVGIPVGKDFRSVSDKQQAVYKEQIGVKKTERLILVTGGSQGATALNAIIAGAIEDLLKLPDVRVIHQTGKHQTGLPENSDRYTKVEFISTMHIYTGAADIVVTRAGSFMAELAAQGRAAIVVPAPHLAGGHQIKNAKILSERKAAKVLDEGKALRKPQLLSDLIKELLKDTGQARALANNLHTVYPGGAAQKIANYILVDQ